MSRKLPCVTLLIRIDFTTSHDRAVGAQVCRCPRHRLSLAA